MAQKGAMTDVYTEDSDDLDARPGAVDLLRAGVARAASQLEHRIQASASNAMDETRMLARRAQHRVNTQLGMAALVALGGGIVLGLLAAALSTQRRRR
jgi:hypothetical protein